MHENGCQMEKIKGADRCRANRTSAGVIGGERGGCMRLGQFYNYFVETLVVEQKHQRSRKYNKLGGVKRQDTNSTRANVMQRTLSPF